MTIAEKMAEDIVEYFEELHVTIFDEAETALRVAKNRNGGTGTIHLEFNPRFVRFDLRDSLYEGGAT